ncbi:MAG: transglutaminase domain-containing protein [Aristaeellaceae bacterium]
MGKLGFSFQMQLTFSEPVNNHAFQLRCLPKSSSKQQVCTSAFHVWPGCPTSTTEDVFGLKQTGTITVAHAGFSVQATGTVMVAPDVQEPAAAPWLLGPYRRATPLTAPGPALTALADALPAQDTASAVMALLSERFTYQPGSTHAATTAEEAAVLMQGVCQDEAHIMLSLLRMKGIPCRYVMGYMLGEGSTHAWVEVLHGEKWLGLDPTNRRMVHDEYITIAVGRDANDCPVNRGVFSGGAGQQSQCGLSVWRIP